MRHAALVTELEASVGDNAVRVVLLTAPRGSGMSTALASYAEEVRGWGHKAEVIDTERVGVQPGGAIDALLRARLKLSPRLRGAELLDALDAAAPSLEPLSREFLAFAMGFSRDDFQTARLDAKSRWEGAVAEVSRWLAAQDGSWAWVLDDALAVDEESLILVERLARSAVTPGLVVLAVRDDEKSIFEPRLKPIRASGRVKELKLPPLTADALAAAYPGTASSSRGVLLTAKLLQLNGREGALPTTTDALVNDLVKHLSPPLRAVLTTLGIAGGRLPMDALKNALPSLAPDALERLESMLLVRRGPTQRNSGDDEVWLRFPSLAPVTDERTTRTATSALGAWAEHQLFDAGGNVTLRSVALPQAIRAAEASRDTTRASLAWELTARIGGGAYALKKAETSASGVRRLVLQRLLSEDELFRGDAQRAAASASAATRLKPGSDALMPAQWKLAALASITDELEQWDRLTVDEAVLSLELVRAEALSALGQSNETRRAFEAVETRLLKLPATPGACALALRLAKTWVWFASEVLADGPMARSICDRIRARFPAEVIQSSFHAGAFLRAEQVAHSRGGDPNRAREMADQLIELSKHRGDLREECIAWNARALLFLRDGDLRQARAGFEKSLDLARRIGFRRREAIALHNLGLTLAYSGEFGASIAAQERYLTLAEQVGHLAARAYGPAALAMIYVQQLDAQKADGHLARARRAAEESGRTRLVAWTRHLAGVLKLLKHLEKKDTLLLRLARSDFLACLDLLEDGKATWSEELDPAEAAAFLSLTWLFAGDKVQAITSFARAERFEDGSASAKYIVSALREVLAGRPPTEALAWFETNGQFRALELWTRIATAAGVPVVAPAPDVRSAL